MPRKKIIVPKCRARHRWFFVVSLLVAISTAAGLFVSVYRVWGASSSIIFSLRVGEETALEPQEPIVIPGSGSSSRLAYLETPPQPSLPQPQQEMFDLQVLDASAEMVLTGGVVPESGTIVYGGSMQQSIPIITDPRPTFRGKAGLPGALVFLELHSNPAHVMTASVNADQSGNWEWRPPRAIEPDSHTLYISIFDPKGSSLIGSFALQFELTPMPVQDTTRTDVIPVPRAQTKPRTTLELPPSRVDERRVLFDIKSEVLNLDDENSIAPGDNLMIQVSLLNIGSPGYLVDANVAYRLLDSSEKIVFQQEETVGVAGQTSFLKVLRTRPTLSEGNYRIEVMVSYGDTEAVSYHDFVLQGRPVVPLHKGAVANLSVSIQVMVLILTLAIFIAYNEYKQLEVIRRSIRQINEYDLVRVGFIK